MTARGNREQQASTLAALGHEVRLRIVQELLGARPAGLVAGRLQRAVGVPPSTLSHHLAVLERRGLIERRREGRCLRYAASGPGLTAVLDFLATAWGTAAVGPAGGSTGASSAPPLYD